MISFDLVLDFFPLLAASLAATACGLLGNILVLRRQSLMGDAISHSVLPGLVVAVMISGSRRPDAMLVGAAVAGLATIGLVALVRRLGRIEPGAAMGVVFSLLFAGGVLMLETADLSAVDLDPDCLLHGNLETWVWYDAPDTLSAVWSLETLRSAPRQIWTLAIVAALSIAFVTLLFKEIRASVFDPAMAMTQGVRPALVLGIAMLLVASATVASFEAVGSILVIAMLICPACAARVCTDRFSAQLWLSVLFAMVSVVIGYFGATSVPAAIGREPVNAAGSIAVATGLTLALAILLSPSHGVLARARRTIMLTRRVGLEDLLAGLYRAEERNEPRRPIAGARVRRARRAGLIERDGAGWRLTDPGRARASGLIRSHRLWERFLVDEAGLPFDHVHDQAERLEHLGIEPGTTAATDPHGRPIPAQSSDRLSDRSPN